MVSNLRRSLRTAGSTNKTYNVDELTRASLMLNQSATEETTEVMENQENVQESEIEEDSEDDQVDMDIEEEEEENQGDDEEDEEDEEYLEGSRKRHKKSNQAGSRKRRRGTQLLPNRAEDIEDFEENELYKSLTNPEASIQDIVIEWLDSYYEELENEGVGAITGLINMVLRCCGCLYLLQPHDLANLESASETIAELTEKFKGQRSHEFPYISNNKDIKFFRANISEFFHKLCTICHTKGLLYIESTSNEKNESLTSPFMNQMLTWLLTLSTSPVRPFRFVSTSVLLTIQTALCSIASDISDLLEKNQRKLSTSSTSRRRHKQQRQSNVESLVSIVDNLNHQKNTISEYFSDIVDVALSHRYRDVDPTIREECIHELSKWLVSYPDEFFQNSYFRYFGWLLSDPNSSVRTEVAKSLGRIFKFCISNTSNNGPFIRQFAERFKIQICNMCYRDHDYHTRVALVAVLEDFVKLDFLNHDDRLTIVLNFFQLIQSKLGFSKANESKLKNEYSKFIYIVHTRYLEEKKSEKSDIIEDLKSATTFDIDEAWKFTSLIELLKEAASKESEVPREISNWFEGSALLFSNLYSLSFYNESWQFILKLYSFDVSLIELNQPEEDIERYATVLDVSLDEDKAYILSFVLGALSHISTKKKSEPDSIDNPERVVQNLMNDLRIILSDLLKSKDQSALFLQIWTLLLKSFNENNGVYSTFLNSNESDLYHKVTIELLMYFGDATESVNSNSLISEFESFFECLFGEDPFAVPSEIRNYVDVMVANIAEEILDIIQNSDNLDVVNKKLLPSHYSMLKLNTIGNFVDIKRASMGLSSTFCNQILDKFDLMEWTKECTTQFTIMNHLVKPFKAFLDFALISNASALEEIMGSRSNQVEIDVSSSFRDTLEVLNALISNFETFQGVVSFLNEQMGTSSTNLTIEECKNLINTIFELKTIFVVTFIDIIVSLKLFYLKFKESNSFINFYEFFDDANVSNLIRFNLPIDLQSLLLNLFLVKENELSSQLSIELDRSVEEDVNYNIHEVEADENENTPTTAENDSQQLEQARIHQLKQEKKWKAEQDLCVYSVKLFGLVNLGLVNEDISKRIQLNSKKIGGLFQKIVDQYVNEVSKSVVTNSSLNNNQEEIEQ